MITIGQAVHWTHVSQRGRALSMQRREGVVEAISGELATIRQKSGRKAIIAVVRLRAEQQESQIDEFVQAMRAR
jgi:hypothetical protein